MYRLVTLFMALTITPWSYAAGNADLFKSILLSPGEKEAITLVIELARGTLSVIKTKGQHLDIIDQVPISIGKNGFGKEVEGDKRTPIGVYNIERFIADEELPALYGVGAYTLDYPNFLDTKAKRTGSGIWIHGIDKSKKSRPFLDSDGCVVIDNQQFKRLQPILAAKPTIVLTEKLLEGDGKPLVASVKSHLDAWQTAWESLDVAEYLTFYSPEFDNGDKDYKTWVSHKYRVGAAKKFIDVEIEQVSMLRYPSSDVMVQVDFLQRYKSNNFNGVDYKRQYWKQYDNGWKIIYEASK